MKKHLSIAIEGILALSAPNIAKAQISYTLASNGLPSFSNPTLETFDEPSPSILTLSGSAYLLTGSSSVGSTPFFYGSTASYFGEPVDSSGFDASQYVAVDPGGSARLSFATPENYLGILWGSVDPSDTLTFYDSANNVIGAVTSNDFGNLISSFNGWNTIYVNFTSTTPFSSVVATTSTPAFEFDDVAYAPVPEPSTLGLLAFGMFGITLLRRHQR